MAKKETRRLKSNDELICLELERRIKNLHYIINGIRFYGIKKMQPELLKLKIEKPLRIKIIGIDEDVEEVNKIANSKINFIKKIVLKEYKKYNFDLFDIFNVQKRGKCTEAKKIIVMLILKHTDISVVSLAKYFSRSRSVIYQIKDEYEIMIKDKDCSFTKSFKKLDKEVKLRYMSVNNVIQRT
jgi:hypothetical protein